VQAALTSPAFRRRAVITAGLVVLAFAALWFASRIPRTLTIFVIAGFIATGVAPPVAWLERRMARNLAIALVYAGLLAILVVLAVLIVPATLLQVQAVAVNLPDYVENFQNWLDVLQKILASRFGRAVIPPGFDLHGFVPGRISLAISTILSSLTNILIGTFTAAFIGISALVLSAFFVLRGEHVADSLYDMLPERRRETARALGVELANVFGKYVSGQAVLCAATGLLIFVFTLATGFKFALLLGIVAGLAYAVPFVGLVVAHLVALILAAPQGLQTILWVQAIVFIVTRISDNVLVPKIMSESVGVSPIVVMFSVFAGGELFGLPGLLLGIPAAALLKVVWRFFRAERAAGHFGHDVEHAPPVAAFANLDVVATGEPASVPE
jgi:predicted PurR-regulated permease PerM